MSPDFKRLFDFKHAFETTSGQKGTPSVTNRGKTSAGVVSCRSGADGQRPARRRRGVENVPA
jgi:hypothetical protein